MRVIDGDVTKLPQWAQRHIAKLEADVEYWRRKVTEAVSGDTDTFIGEWPENMGLPRGSRIVFCLPDLNQIQARVKDEYLEVRTSNGTLMVQPIVSNEVKVRVGGSW